MERGNSKHSPEVDDQLAAETRDINQGSPGSATFQEWDDQEPADDDQPAAGPDPLVADPGTAQHDARARFAAYLRRSVFPADRGALLAEARTNQAPDDVVELISDLPEETYGNVTDAWNATPAATPEATPARGKAPPR